MSATEYAVDESSYILTELINNLKNYDGIIFYSLLQLPIIKKNRFKVYASILKKKKKLYFVVENLSVKKKRRLFRN